MVKNIQGGIPSANVFDYESGFKPLETSKFAGLWLRSEALKKLTKKLFMQL